MGPQKGCIFYFCVWRRSLTSPTGNPALLQTERPDGVPHVQMNAADGTFQFTVHEWPQMMLHAAAGLSWWSSELWRYPVLNKLNHGCTPPPIIMKQSGTKATDSPEFILFTDTIKRKSHLVRTLDTMVLLDICLPLVQYFLAECRQSRASVF